MKRLNSALLILTFLLGACTTATTATETSNSSATEPPAASGSNSAAREAVLSEIENTVSIRKTSTDESIPAEKGMSILEGGSVETGEDGRARIDLMPEGTIVRVGPNSSFSFPKLTEEGNEPKTTIQLLFGKVFVLLKGGSLNVETPSGVASVRGSLLSVEFNPETNRISATCMEGDCSLQAEGGEEIDLPEGQESFIDEGGEVMDPFPMDQDEVEAWLSENPEMDLFMSELPDPGDFPDLPEDFDGNMEEFDPEFQSGNDEATPPPDGGGESDDGGGDGEGGGEG